MAVLNIHENHTIKTKYYGIIMSIIENNIAKPLQAMLIKANRRKAMRYVFRWFILESLNGFDEMGVSGNV